MKICIIAVGYNRPDSMKRLLDSIVAADYFDKNVDLMASIDKGECQAEIVAIAEAVAWEHGEKRIRAFSTRQGLKTHILSCGMLAEEYDAVVVLEDDVTVSPAFFGYVLQAIDCYGSNEKIAGISLYTHRFNQYQRHFEPEPSGYDTYFIQYAQSWGQCWTKEMWRGFYEWYLQNQEWTTECDVIPENLHGWERSWLKYFIKYLVMRDKYFVYPYYALSTNHSEAGEHSEVSRNFYHVPMLLNHICYRFPTLEDGIKYDAFFERQDVVIPGFENKKTCLDLYGNKKNYADAQVLFSTAPRPYRVITTFGLKYKPLELNCTQSAPGNDIMAYDLSTPASAPRIDPFSFISYDARILFWRDAVVLAKRMFMDAFQGKMRRALKR